MREKNQGCRRNDGGYTIIELLIALTLLVVAMIPLAVVLSNSLKSSVNTRTRMHAKELAASEIDNAKGMSFAAVGISGATVSFAEATDGQQIAPDAGYTGLSAGPETVETPSGNTFQVTRDVRKHVNSTQTNDAATKQVIITVSWTEPAPASSETMSTVIGATENAD